MTGGRTLSRRRFVGAATTSGLTALIAACGRRSPTTPSRTQPTQAQEATPVAEPTSGGAPTPAPEQRTLNIESVFMWSREPFKYPQDDVVAPAIQQQGWTVNVRDWLYEQGMVLTEMFNLYAASGNIPDIFEFPASGVAFFDRYLEQFEDLTEYVTDSGKTPNLHKYLTARTMDMMKFLGNGKVFYWPSEIRLDFRDPRFAGDPKIQDDYIEARQYPPLVLSVREDILEKLGYKFRPVADIEKELEQNNRRLTYDDIKIEPEIRMVEDLERLLVAIRDLHLMAPDGSPLVPMGGNALLFLLAMGASFYFDFFQIIDGKVHSWFGAPYVKEMFQTMNRWYRMGLIDRDMYVLFQTPEKLSDKVALAKYAVWWGTWLPNEAVANSKCEEAAGTRVRFVPIPRFREDIPPRAYDLTPGAYKGLAIRKGLKDLDMLVAYLDWLWSDVAQDIIMWGKEGGIWTLNAEGKKVFKDDELWQVLREGQNRKTAKGEDATYYGINYTSPYTRVFNNNIHNPFRWKFSYPARFDAVAEMKRVAGEPQIVVDGTCSANFKGEAATQVNNFFWQKGFDYAAQIILAESDQAFEANLQKCLDDFFSSVDYEQAVADMTEYFKVLQGK